MNRPLEIEDLGFQHHRVVHEMWGGTFYTNSIEGYLRILKQKAKYFSGLYLKDNDIESIKQGLHMHNWLVNIKHHIQNKRTKSLYSVFKYE